MEKKKSHNKLPVHMEVFPMRINKYLAREKYDTRRGADALISSGVVFINNRKAVLGDIVKETDVVEVRRIRPPKERVYYAYYKPQGIITHSPQDDEMDISEAIGRKDIFPIGRIDKDSHGLMILTNDGRITERLLSPDANHEKEYIVRTSEKLKTNFTSRMESGVNIEGYRTKPCKVRVINDHQFSVILTEGKKHQIRRMCAALGYVVSNLQRTRILNIRSQGLKPGGYRELQGAELNRFLKLLKLI